jgi:hypothetical protein
VELEDGVDAGRLRAPGLHESTRGAPVMVQQGSGRPERYRRQGIARAGLLTSGSFRAEFQ